MIRTYREEDEQAVIAVWRECGLVVPQNDPKRDIEAKTAYQPELFFVAQEKGRVVGSVMAGYDGHRGWINYLAVLPDLQGGGVGKELMEAAEAALRPLGCQKINLQVRGSNLAVIEFYERIGFSRDDTVGLGKRLRS